jgi:putative endonuclease
MVYYVYIVTNRSRTLYTGVTNNLVRRAWQHKKKLLPGFTRAYNIDRLVYYESFGDIRAAIQREKQIKGWLRAKKIALIESENPQWLDLTPK